MQEFYVYILKCRDDSYYIGHTDNMEKRLGEHQTGQGSSYTVTRLPVQLVFVEGCASRADALEMEMQMKKWSRVKKEFLIEHGWEKMHKIARKLKLKKK